MKKIYSELFNDKLLHLVIRKDETSKGRTNIINEDQFIQCSVLNFDKGQTFKPHAHLWKHTSEYSIAQESWIVISGSVKCYFYDIDDTLISTEILRPGDTSFTLAGGHNYEILEDNTLVYEYKTGPYYGQELDKRFINV